MDYVELFDRRGRVFDDLLMAAAKLTPEQFAQPGPDGGPSLRDLMVRIVDEPRRAVHQVLQGRKHTPLKAETFNSALALGPLFGGFRMTLRDELESHSAEDLQRTIKPTDDGDECTVDEMLAHLVLLDARLAGLAAERLRQLGVTPPSTDVL